MITNCHNEYLLNNFAEEMKMNNFYSRCIEDYHDYAKEKGYLTKGLIYIPELIPIGQNTVLKYLKNTSMQNEFSDNPAQLYYVINSLTLQCGIIFGAMWHTDFEKLSSGVGPNEVFSYSHGVWDHVKPIFENDLGISEEESYGMCRDIFNRWLSQHKPYWKLSDPREYTYSATLATFQLGVSMILEKYGY